MLVKFAARVINLSLLLLFFGSCAIHNNPKSQTPNSIVSPGVMNVFVDQDGTIYPNDWEEKSGVAPRKFYPWGNDNRSYSLYNRAKEKGTDLSMIKKGEEETLKEIRNFTQGKDRIYILIHGYNNSEVDARKAFEKLRSKIAFDIEKEAFIDFYWDGLNSTTWIIGSLTSWMPAAGYSQLAGEFGLRRILNQISDTEIIIMSHSRGASVALSALSDPPYESTFLNKTNAVRPDRIIGSGPELDNNNNNDIRLLMLAPAIGELDFYKPETKEFRDLGTQLESIHITINNRDRKLQKYFDRLTDKHNPTSLGYKLEVYEKIKPFYNNLSFTNYCLNSHAFIDYLSNPMFLEVLEKNKIPIRL